MISVIIESKNIHLDKIIIDDKSDVNHLKNSFRVREGETVRAVDGENEYICKVLAVEKKEITLEIIETRKDDSVKNTEVTAGLSIIKNDKMELTIQKLTEIGIDKIIPLETKRTIVKLSEKKDKWDVIVKEATKQCQRVRLLEIENIKKLKDVDYSQYDLVIVPYECEEEYSLKNLLRGLETVPKKVLYLIGAEGGFDISEIEYLKSMENVRIVTLGKNILRAETASIVVGGILINEFQ